MNCQLFRLFEQVENILQPLLESKSVIFIGQSSKVGASTCFNLIAGYELIGFKQKESPQDFIYKVQGEGAAQISSDPSKHTLIPNIYSLTSNKDKNQKVTLIDIPTILELNPTLNRTIISSYIGDTLFQNCKQYKIVYVVEEELSQIKKGKFTLQPLIQLLNLKCMSKQIQNQMIKSIFLFVNKASNSKKYILYFKNIMENLKKQKEEQNLQYRLMNNIVVNELWEFLEQATQNQQAPKSKMLDLKGWQYFIPGDQNRKNFKSTRQIDKKQPQLSQIIANKIIFFQKSSQIVHNFIEKVCTQWKTGKGSQQQSFEQIRELLSEYDFYESTNKAKKIDISYKFQSSVINYNAACLSKMNQINRIINIYQLSHEISPKQGQQNQRQYLYKLKNHCLKIFQLMKNIFCTNIEQEQIFINLSYVIFRSFKQLATISSIFSYYSDTHSQIHSSLSKMFELTLEQVQKIFVFEMKMQLKNKMFEDLDAGNQYCQFLDCYESDYKQDQSKLYSEIIRANSMVGDQFVLQESYQQALKKYLKIFNSYLNSINPYYETLNSQNLQENQVRIKKEELNMKIMYNLFKIAETLQKYNPLFISYSLSIYKYLNYVQLACQIFEKMVNNEKKQSRKSRLLVDYAKYSFENGRFESGIIQLQKALVLEHHDAEKYKNIHKKMKEAIEHKKYMEDQFKQSLLQSFIIDLDDEDLRNIITSIQDNV